MGQLYTDIHDSGNTGLNDYTDWTVIFNSWQFLCNPSVNPGEENLIHKCVPNLK